MVRHYLSFNWYVKLVSCSLYDGGGYSVSIFKLKSDTGYAFITIYLERKYNKIKSGRQYSDTNWYYSGYFIMKLVSQNYNREILIGLSILLTSFAQIMLKFGMMKLNSVLTTVELSNENITQVYPVAAWVFIGLVCYASSMIAWMLALREYELSVAYPLLSMSYILVYVLAIFLPDIGGEFSFTNVIGFLFITYGVVNITKDAGKNSPGHIH